MNYIRCYFCSIALAISAGLFSLDAQILHDTLVVNMIREGVRYMYNLELTKANEIYEEVGRLYPGHPVNYLLSGISSYWENYPLLPSSSARGRYEEDLHKCIDLCTQKPYSENYEAESLLTNLCARSLLLLFYNDNDLNMKVIPLAIGTYKYIMRSFDFVSYFYDFYYFTGLYNYYREAYPKLYPIYKPLAALFPPGNMEKGLNELSLSAEFSIFLKAESYSILAYICTGFENNYLQALLYSKTLLGNYPDNPYFRALHIRNLLIVGEYDEAEDLIRDCSEKSKNIFLNAQVLIYSGLIQEKKYRNYDLAKQYYEDGISAISFAGDYGNEFSGYAYLGLSRLCEYNNDKAGRKAYRKKGYELIDFKKVSFDQPAL